MSGMRIAELDLQNFRNFHKTKFEFDQSTVIYGPNASGKSSIIEAINFLATGQSMRAGFDKEMISYGKEHARVTGKTDELKLEIAVAKSEHAENLARKKFKVNGVAKLLNNFAGNFKCVTFTPIDLEIITDGPQIRRRYLDLILFQISKEYRVSHTNLTKVIKNRNKILEKICEFGQGYDQIGFWNDLLIKESEVIHKHRKNFFYFIKDKINTHGKDLDPTCQNLEINYKTNEATSERIREYQHKEIASKTTLLGP
jgi:DNA replication and repair protein RecF